MKPGDTKASMLAMALLGAGEGLLLARGLELCFGIGQYRLIMLFGALGGLGIGIMTWVGRAAWNRGTRDAWRLVAAGAAPVLIVFGLYFIWWILPLIREEIRYSL